MVTFYRRMPKFDYLKPKRLKDVLDLIAGAPAGRYRVYAGGTDVIPKLKARAMTVPEFLVDLKGIPDLDYVSPDGEGAVKIGATATISSVLKSPLIQEKYPVLAQAARCIASTQVQNRGTIAGNICNAVPSADSAPALLCLEAQAVCASKSGERRIPLNAFFKGPCESALAPDECLKEILIPPMAPGMGGAYIKLSPRKRMDLAVVGVAAVVARENGCFGDVRIGLGAVAPTPLRARNAEKLLVGREVRDDVILEAAKTAAQESSPIDDHRASAEYRRLMVEILVKRALHRALSN